MCAVCGARLISPHVFRDDHGEARCGLCRRLEQPFAKAVAYGSYEGGMRDLIHMLKYQRVRPAANVLGRMLAEAISGLAPSWGDAHLLVVPVPLFPGKLRQRGFNQAEVIARVALKLSPTPERYTLCSDALERCRDTQSQTGLSPRQRRANLRGAFRMKDRDRIRGREVLLIDDVFTTGATAFECARVLRRAGATRVWVATVARSLKSEVQGMHFEPEENTTLTMAAHG